MGTVAGKRPKVLPPQGPSDIAAVGQAVGQAGGQPPAWLPFMYILVVSMISW